MISGTGVYFDGKTSARHDVMVEAAPGALRVCAADGFVLAEWPYTELQALSAPADVLRLGRINSPVLARVEIRDPALAAEIDRLAVTLDRSGTAERRTRRKVVGWSIAAVVSLVLMGLFGVPALTERLAPLIPLSVEYRLGAAADAQVRTLLDNSKRAGKPFECGTTDEERPGRLALDKLVGKLEQGANLPIPLKTIVVRRSEANAVALPGGHIYVFRGLIDKAKSPDEVAAVIGHEVGHVANRDGTRSILELAGLSLLFGMLLGDFTGGGLAVVAARTVVQSAYSRDVEAAADSYGVKLMAKIKGDPRALGVILDRIAGAIEPGVKILLDHPETKARIIAINAQAPQITPQPLLEPDEWAALQRICG